MKQIPLTQGYFALVDDEDFERVNAFKWCAHVKPRKDGTIRDVYACRTVRCGKRFLTVLLHRFILGVTDTKVQIDHVNHKGLDCRRANMRLATQRQNIRNQRKRTGLTSKYKGVYWKRANGKWGATVEILGKRKHIGYFFTEREAALAYNSAALAVYGEFAHLNQMERDNA
jgi:hypothetical protein